jgi:DNA mismatch endonuclease Vsr
MDRITKEQRSQTMRAVKSKNSKIEIKLRKALWERGLRYRTHYSKLLGKPDMVFSSLRLVIFCDSEFWHGFDWETRKQDIKSNQEFWYKKIERNIARDKEVTKKLEDEGWTVIRFWGKEIEKDLDKCLKIIEDAINIQKSKKLGEKRNGI